MHPDQQLANQRALAAALGLPDEEACGRLSRVVQLTWSADDATGATIGRFAFELLSRMFEAIGTPAAPVSNASVEVSINGATRLAPAAATVCVTADSRNVRIVRRQESAQPGRRVGDLHPILCLLAACFVSASTCSLALQLTGARCADEIELDFDQWPGPITFDEQVDISRQLLAGAGAVGNAVAYALCLLPVSGIIDVVDPKKVTGGILGRCLLFEERDLGKDKAKVLARRIATSSSGRLLAQGNTMTVREARNAGIEEISSMLVGVDSRRARRELQGEIPFEILDASTTGIDEVVFHHNRLDHEGACLGCIYVETAEEDQFVRHVANKLGVSIADVKSGFVSSGAEKQIRTRYPQLKKYPLVGTAFDSLFRQLCATGELITPEQKQVLAPFGFVSQLAGTILAIEMYLRRRDRGRIRKFNYWRVSPWRSPVVELQQQRARVTDCASCGDALHRKVAAEIWAEQLTGRIQRSDSPRGSRPSLRSPS